MRICLVGPSYPFRGGISHYTTLLFRDLKKRHEVKFYAFKRQYPKFLFPGKLDKDPSDVTIREEGVENILDSMNPISWWEVFWKIRKYKPDLLIFPWWVSFWTPQFWTISFLIKLLTSTEILFLCHNVVQHESKWIDRLCTRLVLKKGDYFIVHSQEDLENLKKILRGAKVKKTFHPTFEVFKCESIDKKEAQKKLKIEGRVLLFFGFVRQYKGLKYLIEALPLILEKIELTLLIVGEFWKDKEESLERIKELGLTEKVRVIDEYIPNEAVGLYFSASDLLVLPYTSATQSGIVQIAYGFNKPVVVTEVGGLPEVVEHGKTGFVVKPQNPKAIAEAVINFYKEKKESEFVANIAKIKNKFSWQKMVEVIESFKE
ncbi:MAG: glycosyltransferase [bacterium]